MTIVKIAKALKAMSPLLTTRDYESTDDQGDALEAFAEALPPADL